MAKAGFEPIRRSPKRLIASVQGSIKSGKTRFGLTGPKPIGYIAVEIGGDEGVADQFIEEGMEENDQIQRVRIRMADPVYPIREEYPGGKDGDKRYDEAVAAAVQLPADEALNKFYAAYYASLANMKMTIVDTGSDLWEIMRLANFGRLEKIPQLAYTQLNKQFDKLIDDAYSYEGSMIMTHHMKEKWETYINDKGKEQGRPSGIFEMAGYGGVKKKVQAVIETWREDLAEPCEITGMFVKFNAQIVDSRHNAKAMGKKFEYDFAFSDVATAIMGGSAKDWK